jgi:transposase
MSEDQKARLEAEVSVEQKNIDKIIGQTKEKPSRKPLDISKLPVREEHIYPQGINADEYSELTPEISDSLERIPAMVYIRRIIRHKYVLKSNIQIKSPERKAFEIAPMPLAPVDKCIAGASILTDIILDKFMYHLPFYRVIQKYRESGIVFNGSTMNGWFSATCERIKPLYDILKSEILSSDYIQVDESTTPVIDNEKHRTVKGYMWCVRDALHGSVCFSYDFGSRSKATAHRLLLGYHGNVQVDGYNVYDDFEKIDGITLYGCWAHARRKFVEALDEDNQKATQGLVYINKLYHIESVADDMKLTADQRKDKRKTEAYPIICEFEKWLGDTWLKVLPGSRIGKAIQYNYTLLPRLARYVNEGSINIDNNLIENAIRPLAIGRKNYLFCGNDGSAVRAAIIYSLISSCKAVGVDPREWMTDILRKLPIYKESKMDIRELLPRNWKNRTDFSN